MCIRTNLMSSIEIENVQDKKRLKRINWNIVQKIIVFLHWNSAKKNHIALHCGMNYEYCDRYLDWCRRLKFINFDRDSNSGLIELTDRGRELYRNEFEGRVMDF